MKNLLLPLIVSLAVLSPGFSALSQDDRAATEAAAKAMFEVMDD